MERSQAITGMKEDKSPGLPGITNERKFHRGDAPLWFFLVLKLMEDSTINILGAYGEVTFPKQVLAGVGGAKGPGVLGDKGVHEDEKVAARTSGVGGFGRM